MPNATTLLSEYVPQRRRSLLITIMFSGFTFGSAVIGFIAGYLIPHFGWRAVLLVGGITPLVLVPFLVVLLPESARYMALQGAPAGKIANDARPGDGRYRFTGGERFVSSEPSLRTKRPIGVLFSDGYAATTIALWITYFMGLMVVYLLTGWLPTLMKDAGLTITAAANVTAMFQIGATIGAILIGWSMDRTHPSRVIGAAYLAGAIFIMGLAWAGAMSGWLATLVFAAGFCASGAQTSLNAFAPGCYPTAARATGVSWMLGIGRFGSIAARLSAARSWDSAGVSALSSAFLRSRRSARPSPSFPRGPPRKVFHAKRRRTKSPGRGWRFACQLLSVFTPSATYCTARAASSTPSRRPSMASPCRPNSRSSGPAKRNTQ